MICAPSDQRPPLLSIVLSCRILIARHKARRSLHDVAARPAAITIIPLSIRPPHIRNLPQRQRHRHRRRQRSRHRPPWLIDSLSRTRVPRAAPALQCHLKHPRDTRDSRPLVISHQPHLLAHHPHLQSHLSHQLGRLPIRILVVP